MKVLKFGGTSVGTIESLTNVKKIVEGLSEPAIVVVSALGGITDKLINTGKLACEANPLFIDECSNIVKRHHDVIYGIVPQSRQQKVLEIVDPLLDELQTIYKGVSLIKELSQRTLDVIVSYGERMSSVIVSNIIDGACHFDSREFIKTEKWFNKNIADTDLTNNLIHKTFDNMTSKVAVIGGFISTDRDTNEITNLGRGGSDYTAAIIAAALDADVLEIWTDVDGFMTADPRIIKDAYVIDHLSFIESMELCNFGAKVIYPPTIYPVFHKNIPIRIRNTFNSETNGTWITDDQRQNTLPLKGVTSISDTTLITVKGIDSVIKTDINTRLLNSLAKNGVSILFVAQSVNDEDISFTVKNTDADTAQFVLNEEFANEVSKSTITSISSLDNLATIAIVGDGIKNINSIEGRVFNTLSRNGINIISIAQGSSKTNISFVINIEYLHQAMSLIHETFFKNQKTK